MTYSLRWLCRLSMVILLLTCATGCPVVNNLPAPGRVLQQNDPEFNRLYLLYVPTHYRQGDRPWPLVVTCHGTRPFDTAPAELDEWKGLAEQKNFLLVAPELMGTAAGLEPPPAVQVRRQLDDEQAILSIVRTLKAAYSIDDTRVFLTGWSAGGFAVLFTGLRNPDVFRALSLRQPNFDARYLDLCVPMLDRYQAVQVTYGSIDPFQQGGLDCIDWLRKHEMEPTIQERSGTHRRDTGPVYDFFVSVVRHRPWIRIHVLEDPLDPMNVTFSVKTSFDPLQYLWDFGDGTDRVATARPAHRYDAPGTYNVRVGLWRSEKDKHVRMVQLQMPRVRLGAAPPPPATQP